MKADAARGRLWVATTNAFWDTPKKEAELLALDIKTGRVVARHSHAEAASFNDLDIAPDGAIYVTDSDGGAVFRLPADGSAMQRVTPKGAMGYPNGIAWLNGRLYVAQGISLRRVDPATGTVASVRSAPGFPGLGIDGLYAHDGGLIAVQGFGYKGRISRLELSADGTAVTAARLLEAGNPAFDAPTTAAPAGDRLYVLANSQLDRVRPDGTVSAAPALKPIVILELPLAR
jgi:sugar lactone lactonase YvrE